MAVDFEFKDKYNIYDLISLVTVLRAPGGCPWDAAQTHNSIKKNFIEETYEVIEAINKNSVDGLREELGDILLQVALHCEMEREQNHFDFDDVCDEICKKLIIRHPHVFGDVNANNEKEALASWDAIKLKTKGYKNQSESMLNVPLELPALMRAQKIQSKAANVGFDWEDVGGAIDKVYEEADELKEAITHNDKENINEELGDLLFACVNISRFVSADSEETLTCATNKFMARFQLVEKMAQEKGISIEKSSVDELNLLWDKAKDILAQKGK